MALKPCRECGQKISTEAKACPFCGKTKTGCFAMGCAVILGFFVLTVVAGLLIPPLSNRSGTSVDRPRAKSAKEQVQDSLALDYSWSKEGFGSVMEATFSVRNRSHHGIKDLEITCIHSAASGTVIDKNKRTIYDVVPAKKSRTFAKVNMGFINSQANRSGCKITNFVLTN